LSYGFTIDVKQNLITDCFLALLDRPEVEKYIKKRSETQIA